MSTVLKWLREQPATTANFLVQRQVKNPAWRDRLGGLVARSRPRPAAPPTIVSPLTETGYQPVNLVGLSKAEDIRRYFEEFQVHDPYGGTPGEFWPNEATAATHVAHFNDETILRAPHVLSIANDSDVLAAVSQALGAKPIISSLIAWWSIPHPGEARQAELFHRDVDDWRFIKLFVYLTDVDVDSGPHAYVPGSHRSAGLREIRRYSDAEVEAAYPGQTLIITGKAGSAFLENTQGLHRGIPPRSRQRLLFQVIYSLSKSPYGPPRPLARRADFAELDLDPYVNQVYLG